MLGLVGQIYAKNLKGAGKSSWGRKLVEEEPAIGKRRGSGDNPVHPFIRPIPIKKIPRPPPVR
jgi:hypothetical protein